eukprot:11208397-Lingulodinium_polyedra.AAC.1
MACRSDRSGFCSSHRQLQRRPTTASRGQQFACIKPQMSGSLRWVGSVVFVSHRFRFHCRRPNDHPCGPPIVGVP